MPTSEHEMETLLGQFDTVKPTVEDKQLILSQARREFLQESGDARRNAFSGTAPILAFSVLAACALLAVLCFNAFKTEPASPLDGSGSFHMAQDESKTETPPAEHSTGTESHELGKDQSFHISNLNGSVTITGWDQPSAEITWEKRGNEKHFENVEVAIHAADDGLHVETRYKKNAKGKTNVSVQFTIKLPAATPATATVTNGDIHIKEIRADIKASTTNGTLVFADIDGSATASIVNGKMNLSNIAGAVAASGVNGSISLMNCNHELSVETVNGSVSVSLSGDVINAIQITSVSGKISLELPSDSNTVINASTVSGTIDSNLAIEVKKGLVGQQASGMIGKGGKTVSIETVAGDIQINAKKSD